MKAFHWRDIKEKHVTLSVSYTAPGTLADTIDALVDAADTDAKPITTRAKPWKLLGIP